MTLWTPSNLATLPPNWWDASDAATLTINAGGISGWANKGSSLGADALQPTASLQPRQSATQINGLATILNSESTFFSSTFSVGSAFRLYVVALFSSDGTFSVLGGSPSTFVPLAATGSTVLSVARVNGVDVNAPQTFHINGSPTSIANRGAAHAALANGTRILSIRNLQPFSAFSLFNAENAAFRPSANFGEIIIVHEASLNAGDDELITGYLAWKWGLQASLPADHPFRNAAPTVAPSGNNAAASSAISLTGSAAAALAIAGQGAGALPIGGSGTVTTALTASAAGSLGLSGSASSSVAITASGAGTLPLTGAAQAGGAAQTNAAAAGSIGFTGSAAATVNTTAGASGQIGLTGSALAGPPSNSAVGAGTIALGGSGSIAAPITGAGAGQLGLAGTSATTVLIRAAAAGVLPLTGAASAAERVRVPTLIFTVPREPRLFLVGREQRLFTVPREQTIFTVTREAA